MGGSPRFLMQSDTCPSTASSRRLADACAGCTDPCHSGADHRMIGLTIHRVSASDCDLQESLDGLQSLASVPRARTLFPTNPRTRLWRDSMLELSNRLTATTVSTCPTSLTKESRWYDRNRPKEAQRIVSCCESSPQKQRSPE